MLSKMNLKKKFISPTPSMWLADITKDLQVVNAKKTTSQMLFYTVCTSLKVRRGYSSYLYFTFAQRNSFDDTLLIYIVLMSSPAR
ncbi:hypothetical protein CRYUN_Cryun33cG0053000 [Craigia yunnanensis]